LHGGELVAEPHAGTSCVKKELTLSDILEEAFERSRDLDAPLGDRLQSYADAVRLVSPAYADAVDRLIARLQQSGSGATAPAVGEPMPPFMLPDDQGHLVTLEQLLATGPVALSFHRGHWCPYCRINTSALAQAQCEAQSIGGQIVAIAPDLQRFAIELKADAQAKPLQILTDIDNGYAMSLNLVILVGQEMQTFMKGAGWDIAPYQGNDAWTLPIPATFVVGRDGTIRARFVDPDYRRRMAIEDIIAALGPG
jgi:peroxiredoxin